MPNSTINLGLVEFLQEVCKAASATVLWYMRKNGPECQKSVNEFLDHFFAFLLDSKMI